MTNLDRDEALGEAKALGALLCEVPSHLDFGVEEDPTLDIAIMQTIFQVNRQNYLSMLASIETDHVILAAMLARGLLEESIRWEWMTDEPADRLPLLFGNLKDSLRKIGQECERCGVDPSPYLEPSPLFRLGAFDYKSKVPTTPGIEHMLTDIERGWKRSTEHSPELASMFTFRALYAQYRVLCQFTHTSVLGMIATVHLDETGGLSVGQHLRDPIWSLVVHTSAASAFNACQYTANHLLGPVEIGAWATRGRALVYALGERLGPVHGLTV